MTEKNCPGGEYLFDNLLKTTTGTYRCKVQGLQPEDANCKTYDYPVCNCDNYRECSFFQKSKSRLEEEIELGKRNSEYTENDAPGLLW